jgi:hypothetical protein
MGYTTYFDGAVEIDPPLNDEEIEFLTKFAETRRMDRTKGPYYVDGGGFMGQENEPDIINFNRPPTGQPGLWCQWIPSEDGTLIIWDEGEKFYDADVWMKYLIDHFIGSNPKAQKELPFLQGHVCNGSFQAQGEDYDDKWMLSVRDNRVTIAYAQPTCYGDEQEV